MKYYYVQENIGSAKYVLSFHDGVSMNRDGSIFEGIRTFKYKRLLKEAIKGMVEQGYIEKR